MKRCWLSIVALLALGCTETVANFSLELQAPILSPPLKSECTQDPRRIESLTLSFETDGETVTLRRRAGEGSFALSDIPLGPMNVSVDGLNAWGRKVAHGSVIGEIVRGDNAPFKILLLEEPMEPSRDDPDGDGLFSTDEVALGLAPDATDTDGDGLSDGLELRECCSNPLDPRDASDCKLLIKQVVPMLGPAGEAVVVKATQPLDSPTVQLGGAPLDSPLTDVTTVFGRVAPKAVLGEVNLSSGGTQQTYSGLFAVLERDPELVHELDQRAGGQSNLMQRLVDMLSTKDGLFLLGSSGSSSAPAGSNTASGAGVVLQLSNDRQTYRRVLLPTKGQPIGLAQGEGVVLALVRETTTQAAVISLSTSVNTPTPVPATAVMRLDTAGKEPIALAALPAKQGLLLLYSDGIARYNADGTGGRLTPLGQLGRDPNNANGSASNPLPVPGVADAVVRDCTGMTLAPASSGAASVDLFVSCNAALPNCQAPAPCARIGTLLRVREVGKCLASGAAGTSLSSGCISLHYSGGATLIAQPLVDAKRKRVYVLSDGGVLQTTLASTAAAPLEPALPFAHVGRARAPRQMALDRRGLLYVANGQLLLRANLDETNPALRARPITVGKDSEVASMLTASPDGATLDVGREKIAHSLMTVCLGRCAGCACSN
ncbi:MAG: hypothetical protein KC503_00610 [Myxococcales bacterium]|nr:hypothetical protein [Myxococcales bacterium]